MNNVCNSVQTHGTKEDCKKFSKSVSYKNLVGGTATIGTVIKQTRRLSKGSANKPLTAVGTLTSLLHNSAKVVEKLFYRHSEPKAKNPKNNIKDWILHFAFASFKMTFFALILALITTAESRAECYATEKKWIKSCYEWNPGEADNCGEGCTYTYDSVNHKLTVTATKPDAVVPQGMFSSNFYESGAKPLITNVEIDGEFEKIGYAAFNILGANIHGKDWVLLVNKTGDNSFDSTIVSGTVIVDDGQTTLGDGPWSRLRTGFNGTLILPSSITSISGVFLTNLTLGADAKVYCGAENCEEMFHNVDCEGHGKKWGEAHGNLCQTHKEQLLSSGNLMSYPDGCVKMWSTGCIKCKSASFKLNDGYCDRIRYTPAEAAEVLRDDNTNEVTITFRK